MVAWLRGLSLDVDFWGRFGIVERFADRADGGRRLAELLAPLKDSEPVVLAMPRGGVPVAVEVAAALGAPLGVVLSRKLGLPANPEFGVGAIAEGGALVLDEAVLERYGVTADQMRDVVTRELATIDRQAMVFGAEAPNPDVAGRIVVIVDDGVATGATARAAAISVRQRGAKRIVLAVPACPPDVLPVLRRDFETVICAITPTPFDAVGLWYEDFRQLSDAEVVGLLKSRPGERSG